MKTLELAEGSTRSLKIKLELPNSDASVGHQYLLLLIPFGDVSLAEPAQHIFNPLYTKLTLRGYRPLLDDAVGRPVKTLRLIAENISVTAYDLIFVRRIVARLKMTALLEDEHGQVLQRWTSDVSERSFNSYGFKPQLQRCLDKAVDRALDESLDKLMLTGHRA